MAPFKSIAGRNLGKLIKSYVTVNIGGTITEPPKPLIIGPITATGGNKYTPGNGFIYHAFTNSMNTTPDGVFTQTAGGATVNILIVAGGGGGGGGYYAGGGGGGGILAGTLLKHQPGTYTISVGAGGNAGEGASGNATDGGNSIFDTVTALGGGYGGSGPRVPDQDGGPGGSGGGASYYSNPGVGAATNQPAPSDYTSYGNDAGASRQGSPTVVGAGGGGAGSAGVGMPAGDGQSFPIWPSSVIPILTPLNPVMGASNNTYGGGGGGAPTGTAGEGGGAAGGGGADGSDYLGGGGGSSATPSSPGNGGDGGDGIVLIRYSAT